MASDKSVKEQLGVDLPEREAPPEAPPEVEEGPDRSQWLDSEDWVLEKFKDPNDFVSSYKSLEEELRQRGVAERNLQDQIDSLTTALQTVQQPQQYQPQQQDQLNEQLMSAYEQDPIGTIIFLQQQAVDQRFQQYQQQQAPQTQQQQQIAGELMATSAERVLESKYPDWDTYGPKVGDVLERNPNLIGGDVLASLDRTAEVLESIYKQVKYDDLSAQLEQANSDQTRMKQQAQTVSGTAGRPGAPSADDEKINRIIAAAKNSSYSSFRSGA